MSDSCHGAICSSSSARRGRRTVLPAGLTPVTPDRPPGAIQPPAAPGAPVEILPLVSTSDVFIPPRGRGFDKFSFDFPEPSVPFAGLHVRLHGVHARECVRRSTPAR